MTRQRIWWALAGLALVTIAGCDDSMQPAASPMGSIEVTAFTTGPDQDADGYSILVDGTRTADIVTNGSRVIENVAPGTHVVRFDGIAPNCTSNGESRTVTVTANQRVSTGFGITCVVRSPGPLPALGTLRITTVTGGSELDGNGYDALVTDLNHAPSHVLLPTNGTVDVNVATGARYIVALSDIAPNCRIQTQVAPEQVADVTTNAVSSIAFSIGCDRVPSARLPAGSQLAFVRNGAIHLVNSDGNGVVKLTDGPNDCDPSWSLDGHRLAFVRGCGTSAAFVYIMNADGSSATRRSSLASAENPSWSPDGSRIAFAARSQGHLGLYSISATDDGYEEIPLVSRQGWNNQPSWSPDGSKVAFASDFAAFDFVYDIYVATPSSGAVTQLTSGFGFWPNLLEHYEPAWSPDGSRLAMTRCPAAYYTCDVSDLMVMDAADGDGLFSLAGTRGFTNPSWSPDGTLIAFSSGGIVGWVRASTRERGFIVGDAESPAWRPTPAPNGGRVSAATGPGSR